MIVARSGEPCYTLTMMANELDALIMALFAQSQTNGAMSQWSERTAVILQNFVDEQ